jgi:hypothetical protein
MISIMNAASVNPFRGSLDLALNLTGVGMHIFWNQGAYSKYLSVSYFFAS